MTPGGLRETDQARRALNLTLATVAGLVGCLTLVIIFGALVGGLWLDSRFDTRPFFTLALMIGSVPVTLAAMFMVVRKATSKIKPPAPSDRGKETADGGTQP